MAAGGFVCFHFSWRNLNSTDHTTVTALLDANVPAARSWAKALFQLFL